MSSYDRNKSDQYAQFARFYDLEYAPVVDDLAFFREFATQANGPILELGCGTGRVLAALESTGLPLAGVDNSAAMLSIARQRLSADTVLVHCDMTEVAECEALSNGPYWMAFSAINTFLHLEDTASQLRTLKAIRQVVVPGGLLLLDIMVPEPGYLADLDGRVIHEFSAIVEDSRRVDKWVSRTHDLATQTIDTSVFFDITNTESQVIERIVDRYRTRYIHRFELEHLLKLAGWDLVSLYGSYELEPFHSGAERMISLASWN
jgi:SAM-dependent methyltransferase